ncbi:NUDIX hydrolase [Nonomuraea bangladeshensis]|uniref:NUDIX hydrolase n=1 Tax=Nonomuraea bangladeshensis TaxID=404385 RepID=UPI003C2B656C
MPDLAEAATCVLVRDGSPGPEVLLLRRSRHQDAFPGAWVFPGGQIDPADRAGPGGAARRAAVRETCEETGIVLEERDLAPWSCWHPPAEAPRRFRTWFFAAVAPPSQHVRVDGRESVEHAWLTPRDALARYARRSLLLLPPTLITLRDVGRFPTAGHVLRAARARRPETFHSRIERSERGPFLLVTAESGTIHRVPIGPARHEDVHATHDHHP